MPARKGSKPWNKGIGKGWINGRGYREISINGQSIKEHRHIMEQHLSRKLLPSEDVHHINGDKTDNRVENLEVIDHGKHTIKTNASRTYKRGQKHEMSETERKRRSDWMKNLHRTGRVSPPQFRKARGEQS